MPLPEGSPGPPQGHRGSSRQEDSWKPARREATWRSFPLACAPAQGLLPASCSLFKLLTGAMVVMQTARMPISICRCPHVVHQALRTVKKQSSIESSSRSRQGTLNHSPKCSVVLDEQCSSKQLHDVLSAGRTGMAFLLGGSWASSIRSVSCACACPLSAVGCFAPCAFLGAFFSCKKDEI